MLARSKCSEKLRGKRHMCASLGDHRLFHLLSVKHILSEPLKRSIGNNVKSFPAVRGPLRAVSLDDLRRRDGDLEVCSHISFCFHCQHILSVSGENVISICIFRIQINRARFTLFGICVDDRNSFSISGIPAKVL